MAYLPERQEVSLWVREQLRTHKRTKVLLSGRRLKAFSKAHSGDVEAVTSDVVRQVEGFLGVKVVVETTMRSGKLVALTIYRAKDTAVPA